MRSAFEDWFVDQHGERLSSAVAPTDQELRDRVHTGEMAQRELNRRKEWDARSESALYAWQAVDRSHTSSEVSK